MHRSIIKSCSVGTFAVALAACGQGARQTGMTSETAAKMAPDYVCSDAHYGVVAYRTADGKFGRVTLSQTAAPSLMLRDFSTFDDLTPRTETDILFRGRFHNKNVRDDAYMVEVTRGGFTQGVTAKVLSNSLGETTNVTALTCRPK